MTYRVTRHENIRISIERDGVLAYELERENGGRGIWALFPVHDGARGAKITSDQYSNDLVEWVTSGFIRGGHVAAVDGGYVVPAPANAGEFYVSGTGYLCCRTPRRMVLTERPITEQGIAASVRLRPASRAELEQAGLASAGSSIEGGVFLASANTPVAVA
jgi:hypothetical protein